VDWQFLTTQSEQQLQPILDQYQQATVDFMKYLSRQWTTINITTGRVNKTQQGNFIAHKFVQITGLIIGS
jgi:hypothetical protein